MIASSKAKVKIGSFIVAEIDSMLAKSEVYWALINVDRKTTQRQSDFTIDSKKYLRYSKNYQIEKYGVVDFILFQLQSKLAGFAQFILGKMG